MASTALGRLDQGWSVRREGPRAIPKRPREYARLLHFDSLTHGRANLRFLITEFGADRVAMGSDYPSDVGSPDPVAAVGEAGLHPGARALVEGGTAARFLGL
jgi:aminocarboxymuconate-semialdehyde decarboxylase